MSNKVMFNTLREPARDIKVFKETDVIVVGGGPSGIAAAIASARNGAKTVLIERYGHLGGLSTGGLVTLIMPMSDERGVQQIAGICDEIITRLDTTGSSVHPPKQDLGSNDPQKVKFWLTRGCPFFAMEKKVVLNALFDPELMKCVLNDMVQEADISLFLHSWGSRCVVEKNQVKGVVFESKSGRMAILGKIIIDATGDGDMFASAGAEFDSELDPNLRSSKLALVFRVGNVNYDRLEAFKKSNSQLYPKMMHELNLLGGFPMCLRSWREDVVWFNNFLPNLNGLNVEDLTWVEVNARKKMLITLDFFKKNIPGFETAFLMDTASQTGIRATRRLIGEYIVTEDDLHAGFVHKDTIAIVPARQWAPSLKSPLAYVPFKSLIPKKIDNLLVVGRCFSSDQVANDILAPIQVCMAQGEAAGTAAALSIKNDVLVRNLNIRLLQTQLRAQGVPIPNQLLTTADKVLPTILK